MASFFRRTKLYAQIQEVYEARAALERAQHRTALKTKRQLVRMEVANEIQRGRMETVRAQQWLLPSHGRAIAPAPPRSTFR